MHPNDSECIQMHFKAFFSFSVAFKNEWIWMHSYEIEWFRMHLDAFRMHSNGKECFRMILNDNGMGMEW